MPGVGLGELCKAIGGMTTDQVLGRELKGILKKRQKWKTRRSRAAVSEEKRLDKPKVGEGEENDIIKSG